MYLSHPDLLSVLPELEISTDMVEHPFSADDQVKVCSIDLRCDQKFWKQRRFSHALDLGSTVLMATSPRRHWKQVELKLGRSIKLKPGEMILGRTYERFRIPSQYAGKITGRSSYARLGIEVSCTCDLINPGWEGQVPLEIINNSARSVLIYPLLPLAQIFLIPLSSQADPDYADRAQFKSKYMNDDGGPSYWWRDAMVEQIYQNYISDRIDQEAVDQLKDQIDKLDDDGIFRFERFINKQTLGEVTNVDDLIERFARSEKGTKFRYQMTKWARRLLAGGLLSTSLASVYVTAPFQTVHWLLFGLTFFLIAWEVLAQVSNWGDEPVFLTSAK